MRTKQDMIDRIDDCTVHASSTLSGDEFVIWKFRFDFFQSERSGWCRVLRSTKDKIRTSEEDQIGSDVNENYQKRVVKG